MSDKEDKAPELDKPEPKTKAKTPKAKAAEAKPAETRTPKAWALALGMSKKYGRGPEAATLLDAAYETASVHYGWSLHAHHYGPDDLQLTKEDFEAAMAASAKFPTVQLHAPAISKTVADRFKDFEPSKANKE